MALFEKISESIYAHTEGKTIGNVGVIATEGGNYVIDTSMYPKVARDIRTEVNAIRSGKLNGVFLTHYHFDHSGGNQEFTDVNLYAHKKVDHNFRTNYKQEEFMKNLADREDKDMFEGLELTAPNKVYETNPFSPDDSDHIEVYLVGGHTDGSSLIFHKEEKVIFAGDDLFAGLYMWGGDPSASPYEWLEAANKMLELKPKYIIPGHGGVQDTLKEVDYLKQYLENIIQTGEKLVKDNVSDEEAITSLSNLDYHEEAKPGMKEGTVKHWFNVIKNH